MYVIEVILLTYFVYVTSYSFILSFSALFYKQKKAPASSIKNKIAVLIPAYKEDGVIVGVAEQALRQQYPSSKFDVVVIADSLQKTTLQKLRNLPIKVIEVAFEKSTKVRALNKAMEKLGYAYDGAVILDADNVMEPQFLRKMNDLYNIGYKGVQGRRDPKNQNTQMAVLDGLSETINNFIYRQGNVAVGLSSSLNGSGMFFDYPLLKRTMATMDSIGGFDRELEYKLLEQGVAVYYAKDIIVYDEKVENAEVFQKQRTRWISSQFHYLAAYFGRGMKALLKGNFQYFNSTVLRNAQLPRLMNLGLLFLVTLVAVVFWSKLHFTPFIWITLLAMNILAMMFAIPGRFYNLHLLKSVVLVPVVFARMVMVMLKLKNANKTFIHTPHGQINTSDSKSI